MYETILAFCFAIVVGGQPANPCWIGKEKTRFSTLEECEFYAERREAHVARLHAVGFSRCDVWFQCLNFASLIAIA